MLEKKLQVGLVGLGKMGSYHLEKLIHHPEVSLVGIYDKDPDRSLKVSEQYGLKQVIDPEELIFDLDALFIASPTSTHFEWAKKAIENNIHVFVEKPICERSEQAAEVVALAREKKLIFQTGFVERYRWLSLLNQQPVALKNKPVLISTERMSTVPSREKGADVITDLMIHDIDLILWLMKEPPVSIFAEGVSAGINDIDIAHVRLEFSSGTVAYLKASWVAQERHRETQLMWQDQIINLDLLFGTAQILSPRPGQSPVSKMIQLNTSDALADQVDAFVRAVKTGNQAVVSGTDGVRALEVIEAIKQRVQEKKIEKVRMSPLEKKFLARFWGDYVN